MTDNLVERLRNWERVYPEDDAKPEGSLYLEAADRIEELEAELKEQSLQYLSDTGQLGERVGELTETLEDVDAWVESLGDYVDKGAVLTLVIKKVKAVLGKDYND